MQPNKPITFQVPETFQIPAWYSTATPTKRALAIRLGAEAVSFLQKKGSEWMREETHQDAVKEAAAAFEVQLKESTASYEATVAKLRQDKIKLEEAILANRARIEAMDEAASEIRHTSLEEARGSLQDLLAAKEQQIGQLQKTVEKLMDGLASKVEGLQNSMTKTFSSSKEKGSFGETFMEGQLKRAFDCSVEVVSKEAQTADIRMTRATGAQYFWEVKNYTRSISADELEKFRRDMRLHPDVRGGCLVSLQTGIAGKSRGGEVDIEFLEDGRFILCIGNLMAREDMVFYLQSLRPLFDAVEAMAKPVKEEGESVRELQAKAQLLTNLLRTHGQTLTKHRNAILGHRKRMDTMFTEFQGYVLETESQAQTLLRVAMGDSEQQETVQGELEHVLPAHLFQKRTVAECDERQKCFLKWFLGAAAPHEGGSIELKDLITRAKVQGYSEKYVRGLREELFQEDAWPKGTRVLLGMRFASAEA